jgi:hypothetical protein
LPQSVNDRTNPLKDNAQVPSAKLLFFMSCCLLSPILHATDALSQFQANLAERCC